MAVRTRFVRRIVALLHAPYDTMGAIGTELPEISKRLAACRNKTKRGRG